MEITINKIEIWFLTDLFEELKNIMLIWGLAILLTSIIAVIMRRQRSAQQFIKGVFIPGVVVHELSHYIACKLAFLKVDRIILFGENGGGEVTLGEGQKRAMVLNFLISFAPLFTGAIIVNYISVIWGFIASNNLGTKIICGWILLSIVVTCGPSKPDINVFINTMSYKFGRDIAALIISLILFQLYGQSIVSILEITAMPYLLAIIILHIPVFILFWLLKKIIKFVKGKERKVRMKAFEKLERPKEFDEKLPLENHRKRDAEKIKPIEKSIEELHEQYFDYT